MKKIILILLCFVLLLSGCEKLPKAEPYYNETRDDVSFSTQYEYIFEDESSLRCFWVNESTERLFFYDTFELHILGDDGEWYRVSNGPVTFNTGYRHGINPESQTSSRYDISVYTDKLKDGETYRISTFCFDENGNNYQFYAEFICSDELAEKDIIQVSGGNKDNRIEEDTGNDLVFLEKNDNG